MEKQTYSFSTALSMVVGIVIGSGIFFKADDILTAVNGNVLLGVLGFVLVGFGVIFGALTTSYYAMKDKEHIGIIGYGRMALGDKFAFFIGWFSVSCYFPALIVVLAMVDSIYLGVLLGIDNQMFITVATALFLVCSFVINVKSPEVGGKLQVVFTIAKVIPLILIGVVGTLFFDNASSVGLATTHLEGGAPLSALIAIAFAFDGWIVATNIARELKAPEKNLPKALGLGTLLITLIYIVYFFGVSQIVGPEQIVALGDAHTEVAAQAILGEAGGKVITLFVVLSVYGGLNGMTLAYLRLPRLLVDCKLMKPFKGEGAEAQVKGTVKFCALILVGYYVFQQLLDFGLIFSNLENGFDLSSMPIFINYIVYLLLFLMVNKLTKKEDGGTRGFYLVTSVLASITAVVVLFGALQVNGLLYLVFCILLTLLGLPFVLKEAK